VHSLPVPLAADAAAVVSVDESLLPQAPKVRDPIATRTSRARLLADLRIFLNLSVLVLPTLVEPRGVS
jgi:hypothetical protein